MLALIQLGHGKCIFKSKWFAFLKRLEIADLKYSIYVKNIYNLSQTMSRIKHNLKVE